MPLVRPGMQKPPPGFDVIAEKLEEFMDAMKEAIQEDSRGVVGQTKKAAGAKRARESLEAAEDGAEGASSAQLSSSSAGTDRKEEATADDTVAAEKPVPPLWRVAQINRDRTRFVADACFRHKTISKAVFDYCCEMQFIDAGLARRWRLPGYERLCCTACGVPGSAAVAANVTSRFALRDRQEVKDKKAATSEHATCVCRVPASQRRDRRFLACAVCGCQGCCSADAPPKPSSAKVTSEDA